MKLIDFVNGNNPALKDFDKNELYDWFKKMMINPPHSNFKSPKELAEYEMKDGDKIGVAMHISKYREVNTLHINDLRNNVSDIYGLSNRVIDNIESTLGNIFKIEELSENYKNIDGLGKKTMDNIIEYVTKKD